MWGNYGRIFAEYPFIENLKIMILQHYVKVKWSRNFRKIQKK